MFEAIIIVFLSRNLVIQQSIMIPEEQDCVKFEQVAKEKFFNKYQVKYKNMKVDVICLPTQFEENNQEIE